MTEATVRSGRDGAAYIITLARPEKRNAVSRAMMDAIMAAAEAAEADADAAAVIVHGGAEVFSAGADLNEVRALGTTDEARTYFESWHRLTAALEDLSKPVVAAIEGACFTGGLELALACDLRIAGAGATFAVTSARIGTVAGAGGTQRLPRLVGPANALALLFSAEPIAAGEAHRIGLVNEVVPAGRALERAKGLAATYGERAPLGLAFAKRAVHRGMRMDLAQGLEFETRLVTTIYGTEDKEEGIAAFLEKRKPRFKGR